MDLNANSITLRHEPLQLDDHRVLVAKIRILPALEAIRPDLLRQLRALDFVKPNPVEKVLLIGEREDSADLKGDRFRDAGLTSFFPMPLCRYSSAT